MERAFQSDRGLLGVYHSETLSALGKHTGGRALTKHLPARFTNEHIFQPLLAHLAGRGEVEIRENKWREISKCLGKVTEKVNPLFQPKSEWKMSLNLTYILLLRASIGRPKCGTGEQSRNRAKHHCCRTLLEQNIFLKTSRKNHQLRKHLSLQVHL